MRAAALLFAAFFCAAAIAREPAPNKTLHAIFDREFRLHILEFPEEATYLGLDGSDHRLSDRSPAAVARRKARLPRVIAELERVDPARLNTQDRISREVVLTRYRLQSEQNALYGKLPFAASDSWAPATSMVGPPLTFSFLVKATRFRTAADYANYLKRLEAVPLYLQQLTDTMRAGMASGWMPPRVALQQVPGMFTVFAGTDVTATPLWRPFEEYPGELGAAERERLTAAGRKVLAEKVHPAFARMKQFIEAEYLPAARTGIAASDLPAGPAYYAHLVRDQTTTTLGIEEIHQIGLREVARIRAEMDKVIASTGFQGDFQAFLKFLHTDPRFFFKRPEDRLRAYRDIAKRADAELPRLFAELPRAPYGIRPMEEYEGDNSDYYSPPAIDGSRAGFFSANVNRLENRPSYEMETILLHEAVPGHHLQIARALELKDLPMLRRAAGYTAYIEGWALYAETLGYEMGFFKDPYQRFGRHQADMLRAVRLVIDTGLHAKGWTREQAIRYFVENGAGNADYAAAEVDRYIVWPAQALGYKIGELRIHALRDKARAALGERFDIRRFHNALLDDGALPLNVLESSIERWIAAQRATSPVPATLTIAPGARK